MKIKDSYLPRIGSEGREELEMFFSWTFEDAYNAWKKWPHKDNASHGQRDPLTRWIDAHDLLSLAATYESTKENGIVLEAIFTCAMNGFAIPVWCAQAYIDAVRKVRHYRAKSWDDVFGKPHPQGTQLEAKKSELYKSPAVYNRVTEIKQRNPETPIDRSLFEKIGKEFGLSGSLAERYYYKIKKRNPLSNQKI
jgi:hypothetical protein